MEDGAHVGGMTHREVLPWTRWVGLLELKSSGMERDAHMAEIMDFEPSEMDRPTHPLPIHGVVTYVGVLAPKPEEAATGTISKLEGSRIHGDGHQGVRDGAKHMPDK